MIRQFLRRAAMALAITLSFVGQETWALAGTTGGVSGVVTDAGGAPVAGAAVKAVSASQSASATTDNAGRFNFLSLAPDTYSVSIEKDGYSPLSYAGVTVFADNNLTLSFRLEKALKTIAKVSATSAGNLVKGGVGSDIYSVNSQAITTAAALGGGGSLNSAYSAIASVPGVTVSQGGNGWNQSSYVRGSQFFFTGFEYDGIPVNRSFDNYNSSTESSLGLQELQVYTGGGPSSSASSGTSGFINQVFKTGTYPGYLSLGAGIGTPTFYHQAKVEAGGATPDRRFSYYVGLSGYNQAFRFLDNSNGGALANDPVGIYTGQSPIARGSYNLYGSPSLATECSPGTANDPNPLLGGGTLPASGPWSYLQGDLNNGGFGTPDFGGISPNCNIPYNGIYGFVLTPSMLLDRENVANFHFRIPRNNGTSDDIQLLGSTSMMFTQWYTSANDAGGYGPYTLAVTGAPYDPANNYPSYADAVVYNAPFGTPIANLATQQYFQPSSPTNRAFGAEIPADQRDGYFNDTGIVKLQYTHQFSSNAFARVFGYTFFSDWTQSGTNSAWNGYVNAGVGPTDYQVAANYDLITHTAGGQVELVDQINSSHLLQLTANYTTASVVRFNNSGYTAGASPIGIVSNNAGTFSCWDEHQGDANYDQAVPCVPSGSAFRAWGSNAISGPYGSGALGPNASSAGAQWVTLWNGNASGSYNTVKPEVAFLSLSDQWRPTDRLLLNLQLRYEDYRDHLLVNPGEASEFYAQIIHNDVCVNQSGTVLTQPLTPGAPPPAPTIYTSSCAAGTVIPKYYPNGLPAGYSHPNFTATSPSIYEIQDVSPRLSATYTQSPDTVWRGSIGRFTEPPISASVQYLNVSGNNLSIWNATLPLGFDSPFHPIPQQSATQADLSLERHIHGTDMSFKISPFYNYTVGYQSQSYIGPNFVSQAPVGNFRSMGVEFAFTKGDFSKDGLSTQLAATYTKAQVQYTNYFGINQLNSVNQAISQFNVLTKGGGGSPFYCSNSKDGAGNASPGSATAAGCAGMAPIDPSRPISAIANPYYNMGQQGLLDTSGWYAPGDIGLSPTSNPSTTYYDSPWNFTALLNYRKQRFAATLSLQATEGSSYGGPLDVVGFDPRTCGYNSSDNVRQDPGTGATIPVTPITTLSPGTNPFQCDALSASGTFSNAAGQLFIPNPQTGSFATPGAFHNPWMMVGNLALTYDFSSRISASVTLANLFHTCWGGTKAPWTSAYPAGNNICGYDTNLGYVGNFYNGTSPNDFAANGVNPPAWELQSYTPRMYTDAGSIPSPFNVFFQMTIKV